MAYRIIVPIDKSRLVAYFKRRDLYGYATSTEVLLADRIACFCTEADVYTLPTSGQAYMRPAGKQEFETNTTIDLYKWWMSKQDDETETVRLAPTCHLLEPTEKQFLRRFDGDKGITVWLEKAILDIFSTYVGTLEQFYRFETLQDAKLVRISFNVNANNNRSAEWKSVALVSPYVEHNR